MQKEQAGIAWERLAAILFVFATAAVAAFLSLRYVAGILLPFLLAWGVGAVIYPLAERIGRRWHLPRGLCAAVLMLILLSLIGALVTAAADTLLGELRRLLHWLETDGADLGRRIEEMLGRWQSFTSRIPWLDRLRRVEGFAALLDHVDEWTGELLNRTLAALGQRVPEWVGMFVRALPSAALFLIVTVLSSFYFSTDLAAIHRALRELLPPRLARRLPAIRARLGLVARQYLRAYLLILTVTFFELYLAFSILGIDYAFLIAGAVALIDMLPLFGVGIVLVPWAAVLLIGRQFYVGFGLLITYGVVQLVRQIIEPRVVAGSLGLHPLLTLFCMYAGYRLFGVLGMILSPAAAILLAGLFRPCPAEREGGAEQHPGGPASPGKPDRR